MASQDKVQDVTQKKDEVRKRQAVETAEVEQELVSAEQADLATLQRTVANPRGVSAGDVPALQRMVGNRATAQLLAGQSPQVQAKLVVGPAGDKYEREADQVAKQVVNTVPSSSQSSAVQRQEEDELKKLLMLDEGDVQTKPEITSGPSVVQRARDLSYNVDSTTGATSTAAGAVALLQWMRTADQGLAQNTYKFRDPKVRISRAEPGIPGISGSSEEVWLKSMPAQDSLQRLTGLGTIVDEEGLLEDHSFEASVNLETRLKELAGQGDSLPEKLQEEMENAFKADFDQVVIHADSAADEMCQALSAQAFTHGYDIYFAADKYKPWSVEGKELIAHELTHVVQQMGYGQQADQPDSDSTE